MLERVAHPVGSESSTVSDEASGRFSIEKTFSMTSPSARIGVAQAVSPAAQPFNLL
ncbi:hypothetical protein T190_12650 [Sinorhizobium meliloti CCBAU 01290]|nr:hypothetical protein T190_12650 [Sinorhizobium meliloti CCBAU 01290]